MSTSKRLRSRNRFTLASEVLEHRHLLSGVPELVADINHAVESPQMGNLVDFNDRPFFTFDQPETGPELWTSDGTAEGTRLVKDIVPGPIGSNAYSPTVVQGRLFFQTNHCDSTGCSGEVWTSDGTEQGTIALTSVTDGYAMVIPDPVGQHTLFTITAPDGISLWTTDGTPEGTRGIAQLSDKYGSLQRTILDQDRVLLWLNSCALFCSSQVWSSDGTEENTHLLLDLDGRALSLWDVSAVGDRILYSTSTCSGGCAARLWSMDHDGANAVELLELPNSGISEIRAADEGILFYVNDSSGRAQLWTSDGTLDGTHRLSALNRYNYIRPYVDFDGNLWMVANSNSKSDIWVSDGREEGTHLFHDGARGSYIQSLEVVGSSLFFTEQSCTTTCRTSLWTSHGISEGTRELYRGEATVAVSMPVELDKALYFTASSCDLACSTQLLRMDNIDAPALSIAQFVSVDQLINSSGRLFLIAQRGNDGKRVWVVDENTLDLSPLTEMGRRTEDGLPLSCWWSCDQSFLFQQGGELYFAATDDFAQGQHLWKSDGTTTGTVLVSNVQITPPAFNSAYGMLQLTPETGPFFVASDGESGSELWTSDGTEEGTRQVVDIGPGQGGSYPTLLATVEDKVVFSANDSTSTSGQSLWASDGSEAGTSMIKQGAWVNTYERGAIKTPGGQLLFTMGDNLFGEELWKSDGTQSGTVLVSDVVPGPNGSSPRQLTSVGDRVYFVADGGQGAELWVVEAVDSDSPTVQPVTGESGVRNVGQLYAVSELIYFVADSIDHGRELWVTDGSQIGTVPVHDVHSGPMSSYPEILGASNGLLYFLADDGQTGRDLWLTDGRDDGTFLVRDFTDDTYVYEQLAIEFDGELYFKAEDPRHGQELWRTDGTHEGTVMVADINLGPAGSRLEQFVVVNDSLLFAADDDLHGRELWVIRGSETSERYPTDLTITNTRGDSRVSPGQWITYTIVVTNQGPQAVTGAVVTDEFPIELLDATWTCTATDGSYCRSSGSGHINDTVDLPVGGSVTYIASVMLDPAASPGTILKTRATVKTPSGLSDLVAANSSQLHYDVIGRVEARWDGAAPIGAPGDGRSWDDVRNWSIALLSDLGPLDSQPNVNLAFPSVSADPAANMDIELGTDRHVSDLSFDADYTLRGNSLTLASGIVSVAEGAQATIHAGVTAPNGLTKRGAGRLVLETLDGNAQVAAGTLALNESARNVTVGHGTLTGSGTLEQLTVTPAGTVAVDAGMTFEVTGQARIDGTLIVNITRDASIAVESKSSVRLGDDSVLQLRAAASLAAPGHTLLPVIRGSSVRGSFAEIPHQHIGYGVFTVEFPNSSTSLSNTSNRIWVALLQAKPGDANGDGRFNQLDIVDLLQAGKYLTNQPADWTEGDWNLDGVFDQRDFVAAQRTESYVTGTELVVTMEDYPTAAAPGHALTGTITISNEGPLAVAGAEVSQLFPPAWMDPQWTCVASTDSVCTAHGQGDLVDSIVLPVGGNVTYSLAGLLDISVQPGKALMMSASVHTPSTLHDIRPDNNMHNRVVQVLPIVAHWDGDEEIGVRGDGTSWDDAANWSIGLLSDTAPSSLPPGVDLVFGDASAVDEILLGGDRHAQSLRFEADQTLAGNRLILRGQTLDVATGVTATIRSELQAQLGVNKIGAGALIVDTLAGDARVQGGTFVLEGSGGNIGVSSGELVVNGTAGEVVVTGGILRGSGSMTKLTVGSSGMAVVGTDGTTFVNENVQIDGTLRAEFAVQGAPLLSVSRRVLLGPESALQLHTTQPLGRPGDVFVQIVEGTSLGGRFSDTPSQHIGFGVFTREVQATGSFLVYTDGSIWASLYQAEAGDTDGSGTIDRHDLVQVLQAGKYASEKQADWTEGDWNADGRFDSLDIVAALNTRQ